jgi:hypothetical protein
MKYAAYILLVPLAGCSWFGTAQDAASYELPEKEENGSTGGQICQVYENPGACTALVHESYAPRWHPSIAWPS